jgi:hypothetical protein
MKVTQDQSWLFESPENVALRHTRPLQLLCGMHWYLRRCQYIETGLWYNTMHAGVEMWWLESHVLTKGSNWRLHRTEINMQCTDFYFWFPNNPCQGIWSAFVPTEMWVRTRHVLQWKWSWSTAFPKRKVPNMWYVILSALHHAGQ